MDDARSRDLHTVALQQFGKKINHEGVLIFRKIISLSVQKNLDEKKKKKKKTT